MDRKETDALEGEDFRKCAVFHGHVCPGLATGYRAARAGLEWLNEHRAEDEEIVAVVETDSCAADAVQVLTGCTFGKGNFFFDDQGKMAFTFLSRRTGRGVRLVRRSAGHAPGPGDRHRELMDRVRAGDASPEERAMFQRLHLEKAREVLSKPLEDLFRIEEVERTLPPKARIEPSGICDGCGEPVMASRLAQVDLRRLCRACATGVPGAASILYADRLVEISDSGILFRLYYFPFGSKRVCFEEIESIEAVDCTLAAGKWRLWGTGDFRTWFPCDRRRFARDRIFFLRRHGKKGRIGFSVEDSAAAGAVLEARGLLRP